MAERPLPARRYSDDEVARLLQRATELQRHDPLLGGREGLSLAELESIAGEAGIDPALIRQAANELDREPARHGVGSALLGEETTLIIERRFTGALDRDHLEELVALINGAANATGQISLVGRTLNFSSASGGNHPRSVQVMVSSRNGETRLHIEERYGQLAGALFGGIVGGGGGGLGMGFGLPLGQMLGSAALMAAIPVAVVGGCYLLARTIFRSVVGKRRQALIRLVEQIGEFVATHGISGPPQ
jgi:hypothetical protein